MTAPQPGDTVTTDDGRTAEVLAVCADGVYAQVCVAGLMPVVVTIPHDRST